MTGRQDPGKAETDEDVDRAGAVNIAYGLVRSFAVPHDDQAGEDIRQWWSYSHQNQG